MICDKTNQIQIRTIVYNSLNNFNLCLQNKLDYKTYKYNTPLIYTQKC